FRARAEQTALRSAQHLDTIEIEDLGVGPIDADVDVVRASPERGVIQVDARRGSARARLNAANLDVGLRGAEIVHRREVQSRGDAGNVADVLQPTGVHLLLPVHGNADGHLV